MISLLAFFINMLFCPEIALHTKVTEDTTELENR